MQNTTFILQQQHEHKESGQMFRMSKIVLLHEHQFCQLARQREYGVRAEADLLQLPGGRLRGPGIRTRQEDLRGLLPLQTGVSRPALRIRRPAESCRKDDSSLSLYDGDDA